MFADEQMWQMVSAVGHHAQLLSSTISEKKNLILINYDAEPICQIPMIKYNSVCQYVLGWQKTPQNLQNYDKPH